MTYFASVSLTLEFASVSFVWLILGLRDQLQCSRLCGQLKHLRLCSLLRVCVANFSVRLYVLCFGSSVLPVLALASVWLDAGLSV